MRGIKFLERLIEMQAEGKGKVRRAGLPDGWTGRLVDWLHRERRPRPRLELLEKITLAPKQSLALVEAEGRRFLVATSAEGTPAFYPLGARGAVTRMQSPSRVSW
jgi:hypothetical protein